MTAMVCLAAVNAARGQATNSSQTYTNGAAAVIQLGSQLRELLSDTERTNIDENPVVVIKQNTPIITPVPLLPEHRNERHVEISEGLIDLANHLCHAQAIEKAQPGFFTNYVAKLAAAYGADPAAAPPPIVGEKFWTEDIMADQAGYFAGMTGMILAMNMAHHYEGHCRKYLPKISSDDPRVYKDLLTKGEWDTAVKAGVVNALKLALPADGVKILFDAIQKFPTRPGWTCWIAPKSANFKRLGAKVASLQSDFYNGKIRN